MESATPPPHWWCGGSATNAPSRFTGLVANFSGPNFISAVKGFPRAKVGGGWGLPPQYNFPFRETRPPGLQEVPWGVARGRGSGVAPKEVDQSLQCFPRGFSSQKRNLPSACSTTSASSSASAYTSTKSHCSMGSEACPTRLAVDDK